MSNYFISKSDGPLEEGKTRHWEFPEFEGQSWAIQINRLIKNKYISFYWEGIEGYETQTEIKLEPRENNSTLVRITEKSMKNDEVGIKWLSSNTEGWSNFLSCLKAFLEYGINLRKGGYDYLINK
jgi:uncharacterized protein YndB with AHSA1/START domain